MHAAARRAVPITLLSLLVGCAGGDVSATPTPVVDASPTPAALASPPASSSPTTAPDPELLVRVDILGDITPVHPSWRAAIATDGRVVWTALNPSRLVVRWLTPEGLQTVRRALDGEPALVDGARYELASTGVEDPGSGRSRWTIELDRAGETISVSSDILHEGLEAYAEHTPETRRLDDLATRLTDPEAWLGDDAWLGPSEPFEPASHLVWVSLREFHPETASGTTFEEVAPPFDPRTVGEPVDSPNGNMRCAILPSVDIGPFVERIDAALEAEWAAVLVDWPEEMLTVEISVVPVIGPRTPDCP